MLKYIFLSLEMSGDVCCIELDSRKRKTRRNWAANWTDLVRNAGRVDGGTMD